MKGIPNLLVDLIKAHMECLIIPSPRQAGKDGEDRIDIEESIPQSALEVGAGGRRRWSVHFGSSQESVSMQVQRAY